MLALSVSPVGEFATLVRGFWSITDVMNGSMNSLRVNAYKSKTLQERRNFVMKEIEAMHDCPEKTTAVLSLESFDKTFVSTLETFNKKSTIFKMLFNTSHAIIFDDLYEKLEVIRQECKKPAWNHARIEAENDQDFLKDFQSDQRIFAENKDIISMEDKYQIKKNFVESVSKVVKIHASNKDIKDELRLPIEADIVQMQETLKDIHIPPDLNLKETTNATSTLTEFHTPRIEDNLFPSEKARPAPLRRRSETTSSQRSLFLNYWKIWFENNTSGIRPHKRLEYAELFYMNDITEESRLVMMLEDDPNWLIEKGVHKFDDHSIKAYLVSNSKITINKAVKEDAPRARSDTEARYIDAPPRPPASEPPASSSSAVSVEPAESHTDVRGRLVKQVSTRMFEIGDIKEGYGFYIYENGDAYEGEWRNNKRNGYGRFTYAGGTVYEGNYVDDYEDGRGQCSFNSGNIYIGEFHKGYMHGYGTFTWSNGDIYFGEFSYDKRSGHGTLSSSNGNVLSEGYWKDDKLVN